MATVGVKGLINM